MPETPSPFQRLLGDGFTILPPPVRRLHSLQRDATTAGRAVVERASGLLPRLLCTLAGLPRSGSDVPVTVAFFPDGVGGEFWRRHFAGRRYTSTMLADEREGEKLLLERFGPLRFHHRLTASPQGLAWRVVGWGALGLPLPRWTLPTINCFEGADGDRFTFDIDVVFPIVGKVIHYRGWLLEGEVDHGADRRSGAFR